MGLSRRTIRILLVIGVVIGLAIGVGATMHLQNSGEYSGEGYVGASDNGPQVALPGEGSQVNLEETPPSDHELRVETDIGNATFSSEGYTEATADQLEGEWTELSGLNVTGTQLTINPDDKAAAGISGGADSFSFRDSDIDGGQVDFSYSASGTTDVTLDAQANTQIAAVDQNGELLGVSTSASSGTITFAGLPGGEYDVRLVTGESPEITNQSPTGDLDSPPTEISADIADPDFGNGDVVNVTVTLNGEEIYSEEITSEQSITATIPETGKTAGRHIYTIEATDEFGNFETEQESYRIPDTLYIRDETNTDELVDDPTEVTVRFFGDNNVYERSTTAGTINMTGLPVDQEFAVQIEADNYTSRTVHINSIYDQQDVFLLPNTESSIDSRFILNDPTGQFPSRTVLHISRPINDNGSVEYRTVHADEFGAEGVTATLAVDQRYRLMIEAPDGTTQDMGTYRTDVSETIELRPDGPAVEFEHYDPDANWRVGAEIEGEKLFVRYDDPEELTDRMAITIHERGNETNQLEPSATYYDLGDLNSQYDLTENQSEQQWVVNFEIDRDGEELHKEVVVSKRGDLVPSGLGSAWKHVIGVGLLLLSGGAFSLLNRSVGAVMIGIQGGLLWWTGWLQGATVGAAVVLYLFFAVAYAIYNRRP